MKMSRQGGKVALKKKDVFLTSFPLEEFRFDPMPMDPSHPFESNNASLVKIQIFCQTENYISIACF